MNNNFNIKRFINTFVWTLEASKKELITSVVCFGIDIRFYNNIFQ